MYLLKAKMLQEKKNQQNNAVGPWYPQGPHSRTLSALQILNWQMLEFMGGWGIGPSTALKYLSDATGNCTCKLEGLLVVLEGCPGNACGVGHRPPCTSEHLLDVSESSFGGSHFGGLLGGLRVQYVWMVESSDAESMDSEGPLYVKFFAHLQSHHVDTCYYHSAVSFTIFSQHSLKARSLLVSLNQMRYLCSMVCLSHIEISYQKQDLDLCLPLQEQHCICHSVEWGMTYTQCERAYMLTQ